MQTDRQTDLTKLTVAFRNFVKAPKRQTAVKVDYNAYGAHCLLQLAIWGTDVCLCLVPRLCFHATGEAFRRTDLPFVPNVYQQIEKPRKLDVEPLRPAGGTKKKEKEQET
jgi:hypothetical protein